MTFNTDEYTARSVYIGVSIGGMSLTSIPPKYIKSFDVEKVTSDSEGSGTFTLNLIAPNSTFTQGESNNFYFLLNYLLARSLSDTDQITKDFKDQKENGYYSNITVEYGWLGGETFIMPNAIVTSCKTGLSSELNLMEFTVSGVTNKIIYNGYCKNFFSIKELAQQKANSDDIDIESLIKFPKEAGHKKLSYVIENLAKFLYGDYYTITVDHNDELYTDEKSSILAEFSTSEINKSSLTLFNYLDRLIDACRTYVPSYLEGTTEKRTHWSRVTGEKRTEDVITSLPVPVISMNGKQYKLDNTEYNLLKNAREYQTNSYVYNPMGNSESEYPFDNFEIFTSSSDLKIRVESTRTITREIQTERVQPKGFSSVDEAVASYQNNQAIYAGDYRRLVNGSLVSSNLAKESEFSNLEITTETYIDNQDIPDSMLIIRGNDNKFYAFQELSSEDVANVKSISSGDSSKNFKKYFSRYTENGKGKLIIKGEVNDVKADHVFIISNNIPNNTVTNFSLNTDTLPAIAAMASLQNNSTTQIETDSGLAITASTDLGGLTANNLEQLTLLQQEFLTKLVNITDSFISDAEMEVIATPKSCAIEITDTIRVIPMINNGNTLFVGDYFVQSVKDSINSSGFTTSFSLNFAKSALISDLEELLSQQGVSLESLNTVDTEEQSEAPKLDDLITTAVPTVPEQFKSNGVPTADEISPITTRELLTNTGIARPTFTFVGGTFADTGQVVKYPYVPIIYEDYGVPLK